MRKQFITAGMLLMGIAASYSNLYAVNLSTDQDQKPTYAVSSENGQVMLCNQFTEDSKNTILVCSPVQDKEQLKNLPKTVQTFSEAYRLSATLQKAQDFFK